MLHNELESTFEQGSPWLDAMPWTCPARVRKGNNINLLPKPLHSKSPPDQLGERGNGDEFRYREFANWENQIRSENLDFRLKPS